MADQLILKGIQGIAKDQTFYINYGQIVSVGRSRNSDISLRKCPGYENLTTKQLNHENISSISRKHLRIGFYNWQCVELKDLSTNGTFIKLLDKETTEEKLSEKTPEEVTKKDPELKSETTDNQEIKEEKKEEPQDYKYKKINRLSIEDIKEKSYEIRLGMHETFILSCAETETNS